MHTKLNTQQNDPNFLTHVIRSKTSLGVQHIHLELLWNLSYAFSNKNKHNSRINISLLIKLGLILQRCVLELKDSVQKLVAKT
jgi:hypothetical protein